ncbi:MAG: hypothetical protein Q4Q14_00890 [Methanobrevibacter sp.]|nr:hypothetical protein [Methanobrevibacter sp.]
MNLKRLTIIVLILLCLLSIGAASADENVTVQDNTTQEIIKTSDYTHWIEIPEGNCTSFDNGMELRDLPKDASGNISMSIDGNEKYNKYVYPKGNRYSIDAKKLAFGNHTAEIKYSGDEKYEGFIKTSSFNYVPVIVDVPDEVEIDNNYGNSIKIYIADGVTGNIKIVIDGKTYLNHAINSDILEEDWDTGEFYITVGLDELSYKKHAYQVTYSKGNQKGFTKSGLFNVSYLFSITNDYENDNITYGESLDFSFNLPENANSNLTIELNNRTYYTPLIYGNGHMTLSDFDLGENIIKCTYKDKNLPQKTAIKTINVKPNLTAPKTIAYNDDQNISLKIPNTLTGNLTALINDKKYQTPIVNGSASISLNNLTPGTYDVNVISNYAQLNYTMTVLPNLKLPSKIYNQETYNLTFTAPEYFNGILQLNGMINDNISVTNGTAVIPIENLSEGDYQLEAVYFENNTPIYNWKFNTTLSSESPNWELELDFPDEISKFYYIFEDVIVKTLPGIIEGDLILYIDNEQYSSKHIYDLFEYPFQIDPESIGLGNHTLTLAYSGDGYLQPINKTKTFEIKNVTIQMSETNERIIVTTSNNDKGTITVNVDGKLFKTVKITPDDWEDYNQITIKLNEYKNQNVEVIYSGKYGKINKTFNVTPTYMIYLRTDTYDFEETYDFDLTAPTDLANEITISIDGKIIENVSPKDLDEDGYYYIDLPKLAPGKHLLVADYPGDSKYPQKSFNETFSVFSQIKAPYWLYYGETDFVTLTLPEDGAGNLTLYIKDENGRYQLYNTTEMSKGLAKMPLPNSEISSYDYKASFKGNYYVEDFTDKMYVRLHLTCPNEMTWGEDEYITLNCNNITDGYLLLQSFSGDYYASVRFNGSEAKISLKNLDIGDYSDGYLVGVLYEKGKYIDEADLSFYINPIKSKLTGGKNINMYYSDSKTYSLKIWGDYGKVVGAGQVVTIKIGKKTFKVKTNKNGIAKLKIPNTITPGTYKIKATYHGTTVTKTLKVKKVLSLKAVKVKKSAKKLILTATLKKGKKAIKNAKVTFKFNGKTYKAKTNKYGIAKVTIKKSVLKKLKVGKKIKYQATYLKVTVKKTAKVKK